MKFLNFDKFLFEAYNKDRIHVNIWDDYKQTPEYDVTDDTHLYVEESEFPNSLVTSIVKQIHKHIKNNIKIDGVTYKITSERYGTKENGFVMRDRIKISGLSNDKREELLKRLRKSKMKFVDTKIVFYSES